MEAPVKYVLIPFEENINPGDPKGIKLYLQATREIDKESDKLDITVSNTKDIIDNFISLYKKYGWKHLEFMVETGAGTNKIFWQVDQIHMADMHHKSHRVWKGFISYISNAYQSKISV